MKEKICTVSADEKEPTKCTWKVPIHNKVHLKPKLTIVFYSLADRIPSKTVTHYLLLICKFTYANPTMQIHCFVRMHANIPKTRAALRRYSRLWRVHGEGCFHNQEESFPTSLSLKETFTAGGAIVKVLRVMVDAWNVTEKTDDSRMRTPEKDSL